MPVQKFPSKSKAPASNVVIFLGSCATNSIPARDRTRWNLTRLTRTKKIGPGPACCDSRPTMPSRTTQYSFSINGATQCPFSRQWSELNKDQAAASVRPAVSSITQQYTKSSFGLIASARPGRRHQLRDLHHGTNMTNMEELAATGSSSCASIELVKLGVAPWDRCQLLVLARTHVKGLQVPRFLSVISDLYRKSGVAIQRLQLRRIRSLHQHRGRFLHRTRAEVVQHTALVSPHTHETQ